jgi:hypothetical protein
VTIYPEPEPYKLPNFFRDDANMKLKEILQLCQSIGQVDGAHHKAWVIDQVVRQVTGDEYELWLVWYRGQMDEDGDFEYNWDEGIAP